MREKNPLTGSMKLNSTLSLIGESQDTSMREEEATPTTTPLLGQETGEFVSSAQIDAAEEAHISMIMDPQSCSLPTGN